VATNVLVEHTAKVEASKVGGVAGYIGVGRKELSHG
jgi:hypothetical protein